MQTNTAEPMEPSEQFCPNPTCCARGQKGLGNIIIHDRKRQRYRCKACKHTFSARRGTMFEGLGKPLDLMVIVVTLLTYGCPVQALVHAFGLDERTVADWRDRAGAHCHKVHQELVEQGRLDWMHVQADEIRVKGCKMIAWMGLAMMVSTRLWVAGVVQVSRDRSLADRLMSQVRRAAPRPATPARLDRRLGGLSQQYWASVPREGQADQWSWASVFASLARGAHWHGDQADGEQAGRRDHEKDDPWPVGPSRETASALAGWYDPQHRFYRALEWTLPGTAGQLDAQIPPCCSSPPSA
jgi:transposase-like protein